MGSTEILVKCFEQNCNFQSMVKLENESLADLPCFSCGKVGNMKAIK